MDKGTPREIWNYLMGEAVIILDKKLIFVYNKYVDAFGIGCRADWIAQFQGGCDVWKGLAFRDDLRCRSDVYLPAEGRCLRYRNR